MVNYHEDRNIAYQNQWNTGRTVGRIKFIVFKPSFKNTNAKIRNLVLTVRPSREAGKRETKM